MKKVLSLTLTLVMILTMTAMPASAFEPAGGSVSVLNSEFFQAINHVTPGEETVTRHYNTDGSSYETITGTEPELFMAARASNSVKKKSGYKQATYYNRSDVPQWSLRVYGDFTVTNGVVRATRVNYTLSYHVYGCSSENLGKFLGGKGVTAYATVHCANRTTFKSLTLYCSSDGRLS